VASDYALIVPVSINRLVLANTEFKTYNDDYETSNLETPAFSDDEDDYSCMASNKFHLHRKVKERIGDEYAVNKVLYNADFDLTDYVETHFVNNAQNGADQKMDEDLFRRLNLAYRFAVIDYTTKVKTEGDESYSEVQHDTHNSLFITLTDQDEVAGKKYFNGKGYFNQVVYDAKNNGKKLIGEDGKPVRANRGSLHRKPVVRVELYSKDDPDIVYAIGYLKLEISEDVKKPAADPFLLTGSDFLFAVCDDDCADNYNTVTLRWDQIQTQLNTVIANGLSPEEWNTYDVVQGEQYYMDDDDNLQLIDQSYSAAYPYYYLGHAYLVDDQDGTYEASGTWTDLLRWKLCGEDYSALYFDLQATGSGIDKATGIVTKKIVRYFRLTSSDSANPDLYVGIEIPKNHIRFPAGTIGRVKGAQWKVAATNTNGIDDIVLNVDLRSSTTSGVANVQDPKWTSDIQPGKFRKEVILSFFGEKITIDLNYLNLDGTEPGTAYKNHAVQSFEKVSKFQNYYEDAVIYFRMPNSKNEKEAKVYTNNEWVVKGVSGNTYTLKVTDLESKKLGDKTIWFNYGGSVSVIKVNGIEIDKSNDANLLKIANALGVSGTNIEKVNLVKNIIQPVQDGKNGFVEGIRVMAIDTDPDSPTFSQIELLTELINSKPETDEDAYGKGSRSENTIVKGISQDMLNYAKHDWSAVNTVSNTDRPYNMQLTAFMQLVAIDDALLAKPSQMNLDSDDDDDDDYEFASCFVMPGYMQGSTPCDYCPADPVTVDNVYYGCFRPFVSNKTFAVRFYQPVYIKNKISDSKVKDATLQTPQITQEIAYSKFLDLMDWTNLTPGGNFQNFKQYYGVTLEADPMANIAYWTTQFNNIQAGNKATLTDNSPFMDGSGNSMLAKLGYAEATTYDGLYAYYLAAKGYVDAVLDGEYPEGNFKGQDIMDELYEPVESTVEDDKGWKSGTTAITAEEDIDAVDKAFGWTPDATTELIIASEGADEPQVFDYKGTTKDGQTTYTFVYDYNGVLKAGQSAPTSNVTTPVFWTISGNELVKETSTFFGVANDNPLGTDYLDPAIDPSYTQKTYLTDRSGKTPGQLLQADLEYERYTKNKAIFDAYYGTPKLNPDYKAPVGDEEVDNARTAKQFSKYLDNNNQPAWDLDGDFNYYIDGEKKIQKRDATQLEALKGNINYQKIASNSVLGLYFADLLKFNEWEAIRLTPAYTAYKEAKAKAKMYHVITTKDGVTTVGAETGAGIDYKKYQAYKELLGEKANLAETDKYKNNKAFVDAFEDQFDGAPNPDQYILDGDELVTSYLTDGIKDIDTYLAATNGEGMSTDHRSAAQMLKDYLYSICRTDLGLTTGRDIPKISDTELDDARIFALPTILETAPTDLDFNVVFDKEAFNSTKDGITGKLEYTYKNIKINTNADFHIYIPMYATYYYLNQKPGAKKRVWATITVQATTGNDQTASSRRK
jgi:hypothetical protein